MRTIMAPIRSLRRMHRTLDRQQIDLHTKSVEVEMVKYEMLDVRVLDFLK